LLLQISDATMTLSTPISSPSRPGNPYSPAVEALDAMLLSSSDGTSFEEIMKERNRVRRSPPSSALSSQVASIHDGSLSLLKL
jgi:hypothetical protein